ncbi:hypothetical protein [Rhodococcus opacus]|uniref:Uncharacterized protein n=1 Tax=Rhodococcus opacus TaxID=37919 RepID=A0A076EIN5_RHOOP|nr:hypothetical protein [Rhodococcus opacus]AII03344.1 hypothetical protein EP51_01255 [Rhodococcus opacus]
MLGTGMGAMVGLLVVTLLVVPVSFGVAARADVKARRLSEWRASDADLGRSVAVAEVAGRCDQWRRLATRAWLICGGASLVAVVVVGVLICVG